MFCVSGATNRAKDHLTVLALKASPLWNLTPWRRWNTHVLSSGLSQEVANHGTILKFASRTTNWSYIEVCMPRIAWIWKGSVVVMSAPWTTVSVPVAVDAAACGAGAGTVATAGLGAAVGAAAGTAVATGAGAVVAAGAGAVVAAGAAGAPGAHAASRPVAAPAPSRIENRRNSRRPVPCLPPDQ